MAARRVLFYCGGSHVSGVEILTLSVMRALKARGHQVFCMVNGWGDGDFADRLRRAGIESESVKLGFLFLRRPLWTLDTLIHYPGAVRRHRRVVRRFKPDLIWHVSYRTVLMLYPFLQPQRTLLHVHDTDRPGRRSSFFYRLAARKVSRFVAVSQFVRRHLRRLGVPDGKIEVILNGVEAGPPSPRAAGSRQVCNIGVVGQILQRKGHEDLLDALAILHRRGLSFRCRVFGKGDPGYLVRLEEKARRAGLGGAMDWRGFVADQSEIYRDLDLVVVPTRDEEPFGLVAVEPALLGIPVVASRSGGLAEIVRDGQTGLLFPPGDAVELAGKIEMLLRDEGLRSRLGTAAQEDARRRFSIEAMVDRVEESLETTLAGVDSGRPAQ